MQTGRLIVITGPSGVGKGTLVRSLLSRHPELNLSVSATTRDPRVGEVEGKDYYFLSRDRFCEAIANGQFLEWAEYAGNYYGTPRALVEEKIALGQQILLEIEIVGAKQIYITFPKALRIFILPPSLEELERRLRDRGTDSEAAILKRLERAKTEIDTGKEFDVLVINDDFEQAIRDLEATIFAKP
ncbi:guanylate kinase [Oscillatoria sp. FACHB-1406]|uniref:guanylate kinase n=1 Tax=Oscillatoria sp. FACHB-1406 TaxID=2692846 RepID=UPI001681DF38|nr:guanylate kinase [Oscillatoria sp. FACHB-1406]MBD2579248.1 guanylate kinase [Oscillatoria sp. FACHB-1406]